ncbi:MAG TPA: hypothetical protein VJ385_09730 [Fibrobacteria bacterium]|nr:hypothetical protein [Fibrobacteria bacterium]
MSAVIECPDHPGVTNDPGHMLNFIDSNCVPYTYVELFLFAVGCLMWVVAYGILIRNALRYRYMEMAAIAVCSNFAWEFVWSWCFRTDMGWFLVWTYRAWFFLDIFIVWQLLKWGSKQVYQPGFRAHFKLGVIFATLGFTALYYFYTKGGLDTSIGANSAYMCQLILSSSCLLLILGNPDVAQFSLAVAWLKCIGTGMNTIMLMHHYPQNHFLHSLGILAFMCDSTYIGYFLRLKAKGRQAAPGMA